MLLLGSVCAILTLVQSAALRDDRLYLDEPLYVDDLDGVNHTADHTSHDLKWSKSLIIYRVMNFPARIPQAVIRSTIRQAFDAWSRVTNLDFVENTYGDAKADIQLSFEGMNHQMRRGEPCHYTSESTLAHAFFPEAGEVHFNTRHFFEGDTSVEQFLNTAIHEIGHSLGLLHSTSQFAIMYGMQTSLLFSEPQPEDIVAIQNKYGVRSIPTTQRVPVTIRPSTTTPKTQTTTVRHRTTTSLCSLLSYDAIVTDHRGNICVLAGRYYYNLNEFNPAPRKISAKWPGLPLGVKAALKYSDHNMYFFKGDQYWKYYNLSMEAGYLQDLSWGFPGIPNDVDAILMQKSGELLVFKDQQYWFYDPCKKKRVDGRIYPKSIDELDGFPKRLDSALVTPDGQRFIFSEMQFYEINDENKIISRSRDVRREFFNCPSPDYYSSSSSEGRAFLTRSVLMLSLNYLLIVVINLIKHSY